MRIHTYSTHFDESIFMVYDTRFNQIFVTMQPTCIVRTREEVLVHRIHSQKVFVV